MKFDIVYDNEVSLQTIGVYMKFSKEVPVVDWGKWVILPPILRPPAVSAGMHLFEIILDAGYI